MPKKAKALTRYQVFGLIDTERAYQDALPSSRTDGSDKTVGDYLTMLRGYLNKADTAWIDNPGTQASLDVIRKIAGITVRCMEEHGAPARQIDPKMAKAMGKAGVALASEI